MAGQCHSKLKCPGSTIITSVLSVLRCRKLLATHDLTSFRQASILGSCIVVSGFMFSWSWVREEQGSLLKRSNAVLSAHVPSVQTPFSATDWAIFYLPCVIESIQFNSIQFNFIYIAP